MACYKENCTSSHFIILNAKKTPSFPLANMKSLLEITHMRRKSNLPATGTTTRYAEKLGGELNAEDISDQLTYIHIYTANLSILKASVTMDMKYVINKM